MERIQRLLRTCLARTRLAHFTLAIGWFAASVDAAQSCPSDIPGCAADLGQVELTFARQFQGSYRPGEPYDVLTIAPNGGFETLEDVGIRLRIRLVCGCNGLPAAGIPAREMLLYSASGCWCSGGNIASQDTDAEGWTEFTGTLRGGGCATSLQLIVDGVLVGTIPIKINSPDSSRGIGCAVDQSDLAAFAAVLGQPALYSICFDYNESGRVDASDLAYFAALLGGACQ